jgi:hypothetical protein
MSLRAVPERQSCEELLNMNAINRDLRARLAAALITLLPLGAIAGSLDSPGAPTASAAQMHSLEDIYNRIDTGATADKATSFTEPSAGPVAGTQHTLDEIYTLAGERSRVMQTGQTYCVDLAAEFYDTIDCAGTGQDGEHQSGMAYPAGRFVDHGDGTVTDTLTQLTWVKNYGCMTLVGTLAQGLAAIAGLQDGQCGLTDGSQAGDWRMANIRELLSIAYYGGDLTALFDLFEPDAPFIRDVSVPMAVRSSTLYGNYGAYALNEGVKVEIVTFATGANAYHMAVRVGQ